MPSELTIGQGAYLSTQPAGPREIRFAWAALVVSVLIFSVAAPFARTPLAQVPAFIPIYVSSLVICDLITAVLLFGQFSVLRSTPLLILAGAYLFTASITSAYALIFPGLFAPSGLFGSGSQTSSAMYMFWHGGFPLAIMAYAKLNHEERRHAVRAHRFGAGTRTAIACMVAGVLAVVAGFTTFATWGHDTIPVFLDGNHTTRIGHLFLTGIWLLSLAALLSLWLRGDHTILDIWLLIVTGVWLFDIALAAMLNSGRYDLGWYVGRIYGLVSASFLLIVLLLENARQYAKLVQVSVELAAANNALAELSRHDALTGLGNRRFFDQYLADQIAAANRHGRALSLLLCDVDHFKGYNDLYGHQAGDECLVRVSAALASCCRRPTDLAARYGGEEFAVILPDTDMAGAMEIADAVRRAVLQLKIPHRQCSTGEFVSISAGLSMLFLDAQMDGQLLIALADQALYKAKELGRNRISCAPPAAALTDG